MARATIVYWRDIPTQIIVQAGRKRATVELPERFIKTVDACAMRSDAKDSDSYLADWRKGDPSQCGDDLEGEAGRLAAEIETSYDTPRLQALLETDGWDK